MLAGWPTAAATDGDARALDQAKAEKDLDSHGRNGGPVNVLAECEVLLIT